jgi:hypothetical protein
MARTTSANVESIIEVDASISLLPFISVANELVTEMCLDSGYSDERLELIERWLAAHFYCTRDPRPTRQQAGPVAENLQSIVDLGLNNSHYGQAAMVFDTAGNLKRLNKGKKAASVTWLGNEDDRGDVDPDA